jgi:hypothetical protein
MVAVLMPPMAGVEWMFAGFSLLVLVIAFQMPADRIPRKNIVGACVAVLLFGLFCAVTQAADLAMSCEWMPWWTIEYWLYCSGR